MQQTKDKLLVVKYFTMKTQRQKSKHREAVRDQYINIMTLRPLGLHKHRRLDAFHTLDLHQNLILN
jgi:hypothetical protein